MILETNTNAATKLSDRRYRTLMLLRRETTIREMKYALGGRAREGKYITKTVTLPRVTFLEGDFRYEVW